MKTLLTLALAFATAAAAQTPMPTIAPTGHVHTADVDLAYWVYGAPQQTTPIFAVNGGPGLSHIYMVQNDVYRFSSSPLKKHAISKNRFCSISFNPL